jgi:hypothetical protein
MGNERLIRELRGVLANASLTQDQYETICEAIRALGGNP